MSGLPRFSVTSNGRLASLTDVKDKSNLYYSKEKITLHPNTCLKIVNLNAVHRHNLRSAKHDPFIPNRPNTEALEKTFRYRGAVTTSTNLRTSEGHAFCGMF